MLPPSLLILAYPLRAQRCSCKGADPLSVAPAVSIIRLLCYASLHVARQAHGLRIAILPTAKAGSD